MWESGSIPTIPTDLVGILLIMKFIINIVDIEIHYQQRFKRTLDSNSRSIQSSARLKRTFV